MRVCRLEIRGDRAGQSLALELAEHHSCQFGLPRQYAGFSAVGEPLVVSSTPTIGECQRSRCANSTSIMVPMKRGCTYEDVSNVLVFLASDEASYMTGQAINVTGGQEMRDERQFLRWGSARMTYSGENANS